MTKHKLLMPAAVFLILAMPALVSAAPNILFVIMDDVGHRDLGFRDPAFHTPTIDELHEGGIRFDQMYTPPNCGPSRSALFSGTYSFRMGLQANGLRTSAGSSVPLDKTFLPQKLGSEGYKTHMIGKWHQGFCNWAMYPTNRGFDSFYGFLLSGQDYFQHTAESKSPPYAYDFRFNEEVDYSVVGKYSVEIFSERARTIIREHKETYPNNEKPFFIMLAHQAIHKPNQVPQHYVDDYCTGVSDPDRQIKCGMLAAVDIGLHNIIEDLKDTNFWDNTLIIFTSDNGGGQSSGSSNWPLRGGKGTAWEGGIRVPAFIYSPSRAILPVTDYTWSGLFHQTDWYATLWGFATQKGKPQIPEAQDGFNMWRKLQKGAASSFRDEFAYIHEVMNFSYIRQGDWKLLLGQYREPGWYMPPDGVAEPKEPRSKDIPYVQLYNIADDPREMDNKADDNPELVASLQQALQDRYWSIWQPEKEKGQYQGDPFKVAEFNGVWTPGFCPEPE